MVQFRTTFKKRKKKELAQLNEVQSIFPPEATRSRSVRLIDAAPEPRVADPLPGRTMATSCFPLNPRDTNPDFLAADWSQQASLESLKIINPYQEHLTFSPEEPYMN